MMFCQGLQLIRPVQMKQVPRIYVNAKSIEMPQAFIFLNSDHYGNSIKNSFQ